MNDQDPRNPQDPTHPADYNATPSNAAPGTPHEASGSTPPSPFDSSARVAFCQDCGKPLTAETLRAVGTGVFCEPCLTARVAAQNGVPPYAGVPPTGYPAGYPAGYVPPIITHGSPVLAGFLGIIPGVGAMYNGQYAKGFAHLIIFVLLDSISKNVNNVFGVFVFAWVCYQIFDAYHTAKARNEGLPLPNVLGLNDIGEKMGFGKTRAYPTQPPTTPPPPPGWQAPSNPAPGPIPTGPDWVGYVPPTNFASAAPPRTEAYAVSTATQTNQQAEAAAAAAIEQAYRDARFNPPPHAETFTGTAATNPYAVPPVDPAWTAPLPPEVVLGRKRFPVGAFWLIGLGFLILLANLVPDWKITERWWPPVLFAGLAVLIFTRRLRSGAPLISILRAPAVLMVLAIMFALHAADIYVNFGILFAILFITVGLLLVLERTIGLKHTYIAPEIPVPGYVPPPTYPVPPVPPVDNDPTKGGF